MGGDLAAEIMPYALNAMAAFGRAVLTKTEDEAADATVSLGRRLLQRIFGHRQAEQDVPEAVADVLDDPNEDDNVAALRKQIRKALANDLELARQVQAMLDEATTAGVHIAAGDHNVFVAGSQIGGDNIQIGSVGADATIEKT